MRPPLTNPSPFPGHECPRLGLPVDESLDPIQSAFRNRIVPVRAFSRTVEAVTTAGGYLAMQRRYLAIVRGAKTPQVYDRGACRITPAYMAMLC